jgi:formate dehydrogenase maturation protein FdhE
MNEKRTVHIERTACPKCGSTSSRITLLTSFLVYLQCNDCNQSWNLTPSESGQSDQGRERAADTGRPPITPAS